MLFAVDVKSNEGEAVLTLRGELGPAQPRFMAALADLGDDLPRVVLDLSELTFIDCANIGIIERVRMLAGLRGTAVVLRSPNADIHRILELTGLSLKVCDDGARPIVVAKPSDVYERPVAAR